MTFVVDKIIHSWTENGIIQHEDAEVYAFGVETILSTVLNIVSLLLLASFFGLLREAALVLVVMIPLQSCAGGYHADTRLNCFLIMMVSWIPIIGISKILSPFTATCLSIISVAVIFLFAPVPHHNVPMTEEKRKRMARNSRILGVLFLTLSQVFILLKVKNYGYVLSAALIAISISMLAASIKRILHKKLNM